MDERKNVAREREAQLERKKEKKRKIENWEKEREEVWEVKEKQKDICKMTKNK